MVGPFGVDTGRNDHLGRRRAEPFVSAVPADPKPLAGDQFHRRLRVAVAHLFLEFPRGVLEIDPAERDVPYELVRLVIAGERDPRLGDRGDGLEVFDLFTRHRDVRQHARLAIEIPLPRLSEPFVDVLDIPPFLPISRAECIGGEMDHLVLLVDRGDPLPGLAPVLQNDDFHVVEVPPGWIQLSFVVPERSLGRIEPAGLVEARLGQPRPRPALPGDVQLPEVPPPLFHLGDFNSPAAVVADLPACDYPAAVDDGPLAGKRRVDYGAFDRAGILGTEFDRFFKIVRSFAEPDGDGLCRFQLADGLLGSFECGERSLLGAGVGVVPLGRDVEVRGGKRGSRQTGGGDYENERVRELFLHRIHFTPLGDGTCAFSYSLNLPDQLRGSSEEKMCVPPVRRTVE